MSPRAITDAERRELLGWRRRRLVTLAGAVWVVTRTGLDGGHCATPQPLRDPLTDPAIGDVLDERAAIRAADGLAPDGTGPGLPLGPGGARPW